MRLPKTSHPTTFTLKMATAMFAEMLDNSQHSMQLIPESRSYTLNSSREDLGTRIYCMTAIQDKQKVKLKVRGRVK
jgi:hypothetical protein